MAARRAASAPPVLVRLDQPAAEPEPEREGLRAPLPLPRLPPPRAHRPPAPERPPGGRETALPDALRFEELQHVRVYAVWAIPGHRWNGVVVSVEPGAWDRVAALLPGGQYIGSGARLRRSEDVSSALGLFRRERGVGQRAFVRIWYLGP